jgi:hypothetical protein
MKPPAPKSGRNGITLRTRQPRATTRRSCFHSNELVACEFPMNDDRKPQSPPPPPATPRSATGMSRREFARRAALTALAPVAAASAATAATPAPAEAAQAPAAANAQAATPPTAQATAATAAQATADTNFPKLSPQSQAETDARVQSILGQYGDRLSDEQKADIRRLCAFAQPPLDRLRTYHLQNADGEALYLKPLVEREKKPPTPAASQKPAAATPGAKPAAKKP